jgi:hypothetical protein
MTFSGTVCALIPLITARRRCHNGEEGGVSLIETLLGGGQQQADYKTSQVDTIMDIQLKDIRTRRP